MIPESDVNFELRYGILTTICYHPLYDLMHIKDYFKI